MEEKKDKSMGTAKAEMSQPGNGNMNAKETTDSFASADGAKLRKGAYKFDRYK